MGDDSDIEDDGGLATAISRLDRTQHIRGAGKAAGAGGEPGVVKPAALAKLLSGSVPLAPLGRRLQQSRAALPKPLERREADQLRRTTGFEEVKVKLDRWNAIVANNRSKDHREFPLLDLEERTKEPVDAFLSKFQITSKLEEDLKNLEPVTEIPEEPTFPLTMAEMIEHRKEAAKLRAKQSYKEAKARRQSKIKSKKFHRIQRKEKIRNQLKEFEMLQKTDPEEALKKLEELEKTRAEERVTLRHKSTGQWAKNKLVRAKYDKETRQELAQQLRISKELTQKIKTMDDSESEAEPELNNQPKSINDFSNPWLLENGDTAKYADFVSGYKKYWEERNKISQKVSAEDADMEDESAVEQKESPPKTDVENKEPKKDKKKPKRTKRNKKKKAISTTEWKIESLSTDLNNKSIDGMFDALQNKLKDKVLNKINKTGIKTRGKKSRKEKKSNSIPDDELSKLSFPSRRKKVQLNEPLNESSNKDADVDIDKSVDKYSYIKNIDLTAKKPTEIQKIDPNKFVAPKPRHLISAIPDVELGEDYIDDEINIKTKNKMTIVEAFEDDDIVSKFQQDKDDDIKKNKPVIDDSFLPGWGSWTGKNLAPPKRKRRRMLMNVKHIPRKDDKKDNLIINEVTNGKLKAHMVSELPYPFTSVCDFETSIRAPIGNTFIPESAHKKLIRPAVTVKTGVVIKPMDESQLINPNKKKSTAFFK